MRDESGSAIVEFLLVSVLLMALTAGVLQLALALHVRNTLADAATEGARQASLVGQTDQDGVRRTRDLIQVAVGVGQEADVVASREVWQGAPTVTVTVTGTNDAPTISALVRSGVEGSGTVSVNALSGAADVDTGAVLSVVPPTSGLKTWLDSPNTPWQEAHLASHTSCPWATEPEPGGRPLKSGRTSMSQAASSLGVAARPTPGYLSALAVGPAITPSAQARLARASPRSRQLNIFHLAVLLHQPRLN
jgi:Flp pilus assembly protein TadG